MILIAPDPLSKSFASLLLTYAHGWRMEMEPICSELGVAGLTRTADYVERVIAKNLAPG